MSDEEQYLSWDDIERSVEILTAKISSLPRTFSSIDTVSRGGLVPSRLIADRLGIEKIYVDQNHISSDSLFIDDIFDTGDTFNKIISRYGASSEFVFATLFARVGKNYPSNLLYGEQTKDDGYVVFPWDRIEYAKSKKK